MQSLPGIGPVALSGRSHAQERIVQASLVSPTDQALRRRSGLVGFGVLQLPAAHSSMSVPLMADPVQVRDLSSAHVLRRKHWWEA